jgi:hypothetical protein
VNAVLICYCRYGITMEISNIFEELTLYMIILSCVVVIRHKDIGYTSFLYAAYATVSRNTPLSSGWAGSDVDVHYHWSMLHGAPS